MSLIYKFKKLYIIGLLGYIKCIQRKRKLKKFQKIFNFSSWHCDGCFECRPYKKQILDISNQISPETILDIGCGLGEILSLSNAQYKYGIDPDLSVIKAAQYLYPNINFYNGNSEYMFKMLEKDKINIPNQSLLIASNWTHNINHNEIEIFLRRALNYFDFIIVDIFNEKQLKRIEANLDKNDPIMNYSHNFLSKVFKVDIYPFIDNPNQSILLIKK